MKTKEELEAVLKMVDETNQSATDLNDYHKMRRREGVLAVHEMMKESHTSEDMINQIFRHKKGLKDNHSDAKIINMKDYTAYNKKLAEIIEDVDSLYDNVYDNLISLACLDKWKEWDESQPIGAICNFSENALRDTGDKNIDLLFEMLDKMVEVREKINVSKTKDIMTDDEFDEFDESSDFDNFKNGA